MSIRLQSLGGAGTVTGSRHLLERDGRRILVDCGLFQGLKVLREKNWETFPVDPKAIDAVVLTHAHLDHSGYLPKFVREGFEGPVLCAGATADLAEILLRDSAHIAERDADYAERKGFSKHKPPLPLYTIAEADASLRQLRPIDFHAATPIVDGAILTLRRAGHILGAATAEIRWGGRTLLFSGDLGRYDDPFMPDPEAVESADYVVVESTYGDRAHPKTDAQEALGVVVERTVRRGGTVVIPAFAVGRAQLLLHLLWRLREQGRLMSVPIFLDSPMAIDATELLQRHLGDHRLSRAVCGASCRVAVYLRTAEESKAVVAEPTPKVIIAGSGMATGGRVLHLIKAYGPDARNTILFTGHQAEGTRGAKLLAGERETKMFGNWIPIRAEVASLPELSAHADAGEIVRWLRGLKRPPQRTFIVHGEPPASEALRVRIGRELGWDAAVVDPLRSYDLT